MQNFTASKTPEIILSRLFDQIYNLFSVLSSDEQPFEDHPCLVKRFIMVIHVWKRSTFKSLLKAFI